jgi:hypothetical protein
MTKLFIPLIRTQIDAACRLHQRLGQWRLSDLALRRLHEQLPGFDNESCLLKCIAINVLYGTQVFAIIPLSQHVQSVLLNTDLITREMKLVDRIALFKHDGKYRRVTSFAAKFCHFFIDEERFPIYDEAARETIKFHIRDQYLTDLKQPYAAFCQNLQTLQDGLEFKGRQRDIDRYLWLVGMYMRWTKAPEKNEAPINAELRRLFNNPSAEERAELNAILPASLK